MGTGAGQQGGIMGQLNDRMNNGTLPQRHIAGMMSRGFGHFTDNMSQGDPAYHLFYGNQPPVAPSVPSVQPQGIVSALPINPDVQSGLYR